MSNDHVRTARYQACSAGRDTWTHSHRTCRERNHEDCSLTRHRLRRLEERPMSLATERVAKLTGRVLNVQHFCTNDGPGIRTNVFLKGCSLRCKWCCNPESIRPKAELAYNPAKCIGKDQCGFCLKECPESAIFVVDSDRPVH